MSVPRINPKDVPVFVKAPNKRRVEVKKMKSVKIDPRTNLYIKNKLSGMSDNQAALKAGYPKYMAKKAAERIETYDVKRRMMKIMDEAGLTDESLVEHLRKGLNEASKIQGTGDNFVELPDYGVRHKYLETAAEWRGITGSDKSQDKEPIQILIVDYEPDKNKPTT